jgi:hypothetical protein
MQRAPHLPQKDVSPGKITTNSAAGGNQGMYFSKIFIAGVILSTTVCALERPYSVALGQSHAQNEGSIRRVRNVADRNLTATIPGHPYILTVYDLVKHAVEQWRDKDCLGSRNLVRKHEEDKKITKVVNGVEQQVTKKWIYSELSPYEYRSYRDLGEESTSIGAGLRKLGLQPGDHVGLYADTSYRPFEFVVDIAPSGKSLPKAV